ncbi:MAG: undecaprenyl/decaprenyl-phosphate alpha-N-acetylglucosaminyl 1-phosphate transferase [Clostridia bacterium]|nr:undecaprenyl/decaprenyl-phosphate alpha-N-acetylglucosaminyl 1-phosphate transferase [Clostridia bacterium]
MLYLLIIPIAFLLSFVLFRPSLAISKAAGAIDLPNSRKMHSKPMARAGGFSSFTAFSTILLIAPINLSLRIPLLLGGATMFLIGFLDDTINLSPFMKLSGQFLALTVYLFSTELLNYSASIFDSIITSIWIVFITNATNIIDGLDGLAGGVSASQSLCLAVLSLILGNGDIFLCSLLLLGAILGFLPRNFPRAKIFMGDSGALFLGFILGCLSSRLFLDSQSIICAIALLLIFRVPSYDAIFSFARRVLKGKNPFFADRGHFHHKHIDLGFSKECTTLALVTISLAFGLIGVVVASL